MRLLGENLAVDQIDVVADVREIGVDLRQRPHPGELRVDARQGRLLEVEGVRHPAQIELHLVELRFPTDAEIEVSAIALHARQIAR